MKRPPPVIKSRAVLDALQQLVDSFKQIDVLSKPQRRLMREALEYVCYWVSHNYDEGPKPRYPHEDVLAFTDFVEGARTLLHINGEPYNDWHDIERIWSGEQDSRVDDSVKEE